MVELVAFCPVLTWGRDKFRTGEVWNSNLLTAWLLARSGHDTVAIRPPIGGRAPGWAAGPAVAARDTDSTMRRVYVGGYERQSQGEPALLSSCEPQEECGGVPSAQKEGSSPPPKST